MLHKLTPSIWFGDKDALAASKDDVAAVLNVAHVIRDPAYWTTLSKLHSRVAYFRLAKRDREPFQAEYIENVLTVIELVQRRNLFPLLCHCQRGGHRGPTAAILAHWATSERRDWALAEALEATRIMVPSLTTALTATGDRALYHKQIIAYCVANSVRS